MLLACFSHFTSFKLVPHFAEVKWVLNLEILQCGGVTVIITFVEHRAQKFAENDLSCSDKFVDM